MMNRRDFLRTTAAGVVATGLSATSSYAAPETKREIKKALKYGMIDIPGSMLEKFKGVKEIGFEGVELDSPNGFELKEVLEARDKSGLVIHGVVDSVHWKDTLSDPNERVQEKGRIALEKALRDVKSYGGTTALLVPGKVTKDVTFEQCWERSIANIRKVLPVCEETGIKIGIENVWNDFITKPDDFVRYLDEINSPWVGAYLDLGNTARYSPPQDWVPLLGKKRIFKLDVKAYDTRKKMYDGFNCKLGDDNIDWPAVCVELDKIGYVGYGTAEMSGGNKKYLADMAARMDKVLCKT